MERKNIYIVILTITTIIAACFAIYFYINPTAANVEVKEENNLVTGNEVNTSNTNNSVTDNTANNTAQPEVKVEEKIVYKYVPSIENGRCLNSQENQIYIVKRNAEFEGIAACITDSGKSVTLTIDAIHDLKNTFGNKVTLTGYKEYNITNFSKKVVNVYIEGRGQDIGNEVLLFLMEDGTVEYMPLRECLINQEFKSYGQVPNISNIVDISGGIVRVSIDGQPGPGWHTIFAINNEGNYYDIGAIIENK